VHNTWFPSLKDRPQGFTKQHIINLEHFYKNVNKWSAGPHLFIDDKQIHVFTPLTVSGVHSPSFNKLSIGIELLGDYEKLDDFNKGRGLAVQKNAIAAIATLSAVLGLNPDTIKFHKEDPATQNRKTCPGKTVVKAKLIASVKELIMQRHNGEHTPA